MASPNRVLYRKYRPTNLSEVVGQSAITNSLENALKTNKIAHAYLFIGPRGTGKTSVARIFAHAVNNFDYQVEDNYLDIVEIDAASNTSVENIRDIREKAMVAPTKGKYKVYIIDEVHMLSKSASNALLKTLEEPPEHVIFIMATTDAHKVPITISSRTQVFTFKLADPALMQAHLRKIADAEKIPITDDALGLIVKRGGGSFRDSLSLLDQIASLSTEEITAEMLEKALGLPQNLAIQNLLTSYQSQNSAEIHQSLQNLLDTGIRPELVASELISAIIANPLPAFLPLLEKLPSVAPPFPEAKLLLALLTAPNDLQAPLPASSAPTTSSTTPTAPQTQDSATLTDFNWENLLSRLQTDHAALYNQLSKADYDYTDDTLHIYPAQQFTKIFLDRASNRAILTQLLPNTPTVIHDAGPKNPPKDGPLGQISAIMGNIQEVNSDQPF